MKPRFSVQSGALRREEGVDTLEHVQQSYRSGEAEETEYLLPWFYCWPTTAYQEGVEKVEPDSSPSAYWKDKRQWTDGKF